MAAALASAATSAAAVLDKINTVATHHLRGGHHPFLQHLPVDGTTTAPKVLSGVRGKGNIRKEEEEGGHPSWWFDCRCRCRVIITLKTRVALPLNLPSPYHPLSPSPLLYLEPTPPLSSFFFYTAFSLQRLPFQLTSSPAFSLTPFLQSIILFPFPAFTLYNNSLHNASYISSISILQKVCPTRSPLIQKYVSASKFLFSFLLFHFMCISLLFFLLSCVSIFLNISLYGNYHKDVTKGHCEFRTLEAQSRA